MAQDNSLEGRLEQLDKTASLGDEHYNIIWAFIIKPMLPRMIEERGVLHRCLSHKGEWDEIYKLDIDFERDKRRGLWNWLARGFCLWVTGISIRCENSLFTCTYYDYRYLQYADDIKGSYYEKLYSTFGVDMVVVGKAF